MALGRSGSLVCYGGQSCHIIFSQHYHYSIEFLIVAPNLPCFESSLAPKYAISLFSAAGVFHDVIKFHFASPFFLAACCVHQLSKSFHPRGGCISLVMICSDIVQIQSEDKNINNWMSSGLNSLWSLFLFHPLISLQYEDVHESLT